MHRLFSAGVLLVLMAGTLVAQEFRGQVGGKVTDPSGAVVPGVQITLTNVATNTSSSTLAGETGTYAILYVIPGQYTLTAELPGFKKLVHQGLEVRIGDILKLDLS